MLYLTNDAIWKCNHTGFPNSIIDKCSVTTVEQIGSDEDGYVKVRPRGQDKTAHHYSGDDINKKPTQDVPYFTRISPYVFGEEYYNITGRYTSKILGYDADTHFYLGQYLRMMRDIFDLDMMPFYNCYCGDTLSDVDFDSQGNVYTSSANSFYKIMSVPVRFGKTYTIAFNSELPVEMITVIYGRKGIIQSKTDNLNDIISSDENSVSKNTYQSFQKMSFTHPITIRTKSWHQLYKSYTRGKYGKLVDEAPDVEMSIEDGNYDQGLGQFEKYLRLLIKVPSNNKSSLVVLEGDYGLGQKQESGNVNSVTFTNQSIWDSTVNSKTVSGDLIRPKYVQNKLKPKEEYRIVLNEIANHGETEETIPWTDTNTDTLFEGNDETYVVSPLLSPLGLLQLSDGNNYAFSNRLIEYLLQNVINPLDEFTKDVERIQAYATSIENKLKNKSTYTAAYTPGVWDYSLREYLFNLVKDSIYVNKRVDLTGYVDKDVETVITRGQRV